ITFFLQADGGIRDVIPLFFQSKEDQILGTCLCLGENETPLHSLKPSCLYEPLSLEKTAEELLGGDKTSRLVGFVDQNSTIGELRFHTWRQTVYRDGMMVQCQVVLSCVVV